MVWSSFKGFVNSIFFIYQEFLGRKHDTWEISPRADGKAFLNKSGLANILSALNFNRRAMFCVTISGNKLQYTAGCNKTHGMFQEWFITVDQLALGTGLTETVWLHVVINKCWPHDGDTDYELFTLGTLELRSCSVDVVRQPQPRVASLISATAPRRGIGAAPRVRREHKQQQQHLSQRALFRCLQGWLMTLRNVQLQTVAPECRTTFSHNFLQLSLRLSVRDIVGENGHWDSIRPACDGIM
jgi:hypothetical protein